MGLRTPVNPHLASTTHFHIALWINVESPLPKIEEKSVEIVRGKPELYDLDHVLYSDSGHRKKLWEEIGREMNIQGFIVVAACVMTFEARDSAAKVVPTPRARAPSQRKPTYRGSRRSTSSQTKWPENSPASDLLARRAMTASFVQFSRELGSRPLGKSPSAPDLAAAIPEAHPSPRLQHYNASLLNPHVLLQRQALSVDNPEYRCLSPPNNRGSQVSMAMDLHLENPVTLRVRDRTRRSDTARRHMFVRQRPVEEDERSHSWSPRYYRCDEFVSLSTPHSRRESMARTPRGSQEERPTRSSSNESRLRKKSTSRSASERSQLTPDEQPKRESEIIVIEPREDEEEPFT